METKTFSPLLTAANNIVKTKRPLSKGAKDYDAFVNWLGVSNKDIKKIKLPKVKKVENLEFSVGSALGGGGGGGGILGLLLGGAAGGLGVRFLGKGINAVKGFGKNAISKIFPRVAIPAAKKAAIPAADMARKGVVKGLEHIATGAPRAIATGADDAAKIAAMKGGGKLATKGGELVSKMIPGLATVVNLGISGYRFSQGDIVGGSLSALSAIPILGWAAVGIDVAREFGAFEGTLLGLNQEKPKNKIETRLKEQERTQREAASASNVTFQSITDKFDKVVSKFEKLKFGVTGTDPGDKNVGKGDEIMLEYGEPEPDIKGGPGNGKELPDIEAEGGKKPSSSIITSGYGWRWGRKHYGTDYGEPGGTPVSVIQPGRVAFAGFTDGGGNTVHLDHPDGSQTRYLHFRDSPNVKTGQMVEPGTVIGYVGTTGRSTGNHLHFEYAPPGQGSIDSAPYADKYFRFGGNVKVKPKAGASGVQGAQTAILAAGTNDYGDPAKVKENVEKSIKDLKSKGYNVVVVPPNEKGQFAGAHKAVLQAAASSGATVEKGKYDQNDPLHLQMSEASRIKQKFAGAEILGDSNAVRIAGGSMSNVAGKRVVGAGTGDILKFVRDMRRVGPAATSQVVPAPTQPIPAAVAAPLQTQTPGGTVVLMGNMQPQVAARPSIVPVAIPMGGGQSSGGGVVVVSPSEGDILNSLWKTMLLTNLSSA